MISSVFLFHLFIKILKKLTDSGFTGTALWFILTIEYSDKGV